MTGDWAADTEPMRSSWPCTALPPEQLPEVLAARAEGWCLAPDAPVWAFLPAVWPPAHRRWLEDRSVRWVRTSCSDSPPGALPWSAWDHAEHERDVNDLLAGAGVPARPAGRLWLLRPPAAFPDVEGVVRRVTDTAAERGVHLRCSPELVALTAALLEDWFRDDA